MQAKRILVPITLPNSSFETVLFAKKMADEFSASVTLLNVVSLNIVETLSVYDEVCLESEKALRRIGKLFFGGVSDVSVSVRVGKAHEQIVAAAKSGLCELIVLSTPKPSLWKRLLGLGTVKAVVRAAPCPTLVLPRIWKMSPEQDPMDRTVPLLRRFREPAHLETVSSMSGHRQFGL
jgi:nucleotide-binding universal stress UspA family protein